MDKKSNSGLIVFFIILCLLFGGVCFYYGKTYNNENGEETSNNNSTTDVKTDSKSNEKNYLHVFQTGDGFNYNLYSYLENQGYYEKIIDYNDSLYLVTENDQQMCTINLFDKKVTFSDLIYDCSDDEASFGEIYDFKLKTSDIKKAYLIQSVRSDGSTMALIIMNDGTVKKYDYIDKIDITNDLFKDYKVADILKYECAKSDENGCEQDQYTLLLEDGKTIEYK